jgi:hypothetical protein
MIRSKVKIGGALEHQYRWIILVYIYIYIYIYRYTDGRQRQRQYPPVHRTGGQRTNSSLTQRYHRASPIGFVWV